MNVFDLLREFGGISLKWSKVFKTMRRKKWVAM